MKTIYIVKYSTGIYEEFTVHDVLATDDLSYAEKVAKEIDKEHFDLPKPIFSEDTYYNLVKAFLLTIDVDPAKYELVNEIDWNVDGPGWVRRNNEITKRKKELMIEYFQKNHFTDLSIDEMKAEFDKYEAIQKNNEAHYGSSWIQEIEYDEKLSK